VAARTHRRLLDFRYFYLPSLRQRAQSGIYRYLISLQQRRPRHTGGILARLTRRGIRHARVLKDGARAPRSEKMAYSGPASGNGMSYGEYSAPFAEDREPGRRRRKIAGFLRAANEIRHNYFGSEDSGRDMSDESGTDGPGAFQDAAVARSGNEEMILFPSYARRHVKSKVGGNSYR